MKHTRDKAMKFVMVLFYLIFATVVTALWFLIAAVAALAEKVVGPTPWYVSIAAVFICIGCPVAHFITSSVAKYMDKTHGNS